MRTNNGGPAFPLSGLSGLPNDQFLYGEHGMTLRDYFAAKAMAAMIGTAASPCLLGLKGGEPQTAEAAYRIADAMLAERKKENNDADH